MTRCYWNLHLLPLLQIDRKATDHHHFPVPLRRPVHCPRRHHLHLPAASGEQVVLQAAGGLEKDRGLRVLEAAGELV